MFSKYIDNKKEEMIENLQKLIQIPSVYEESSNPKKPFGENANKALEYMLDLGKKMGFRTKNIDGYCGYIEFGEGDELLGLIGHLDVVPVNDGWTYPPFSATIVNGKIFGRGAIDDKGPVMASLYAMKAVMDTKKVHKRVRLIVGLNEENDWKCIEYYKKHEEAPTIGFSPDADFPCIYAEKSIITSNISMEYSGQNDKIQIIDIDCNNNPDNVVPKICKVKLKAENYNLEDIEKIIEKHKFKIEINKTNEGLELVSHGLEAHAAHPDFGINAISQMIIVLNEIFIKNNIQNEFFDFFNKYINTDYNGKLLEINYPDESGNLTLNVGKFSLKNNKISINMNIRIPIHTEIEKVEEKFKQALENYKKLNYERLETENSLYVSKDSYLVKTLCRIFNEENHSNLEPIAIGGATYARAFKNCISFGANMPGAKDMCHQADEFISIDNLIFAAKVYARAISEL